jgi:PAS domain S-box-containing protein
MRIRSHLVVLVLGAVLPVLAFSAVMTAIFWNQQRTAFDQRFLDRVRGMTIALDRDLDGHIRALEVLSESSALRSGNLRGFYERAARVRERQKMWSNIILLDAASGKQLVNLRRPFGAELPQSTDQSTLAAIIQSERPHVSGLSKGPLSGEYATRVLVPVQLEDGALRYVLVAVISPSSWLELLRSYPGVSPDATLTLVDQNGIIIARTLNNERWVGNPPSPGLLAESRKSPEGAYRNRGLEGQWFYSAHSRSKIAGWTLASGVPVESVESALRTSMLAMAGGVAAALLLAVGLAFVFGRRIAQPVSALARSARTLPTQEPIIAGEHSRVAEVEEVSRAFREAAEQVKRQEEEVLYQTQLMRTITDHAPSMLFLIDNNGRVTYANPAVEQMTGYKPGELIGEPMHDKLHHSFPDDRLHAAECSLNRAITLRQSVRDHEESFIRKDGEFFDALCSASPIFRGDVAVGTVVEVQDITRRKRYEEDLERRVTERTAELERSLIAREELQEQLLQSQKMESLGTLAGGIAHDFNNILNIIMGYAATLSAGSAKPADLSEGLTVIRQAAERGGALVQQLLTMAHKSSMEFAPVDLNQFIRSLASLLRETFPKTIAIKVDTDPEAPLLLADANRLHQALLNLAVNARDAMPGGGSLTLATQVAATADVKKRFPAADATEYLSIAVIDTGYGIEPALRDRIFDPFFTTKEQGKGTGLGLTVAYGIVGSHSGFIDMQSQPGQGTIFRVYLPVRPVETDLAAAFPTPLNSDSAATGHGTLLFVDDEKRQADLMKDLLEKKGYRVLVAHDGLDAVSLYSRHKNDIDVVVMDLGLPRLDGWEAFLRMKEHEPGVRAIFASGYIRADIKTEMIRHGASSIIHKPYLPDELLAQIAAVLSRAGAAGG